MTIDTPPEALSFADQLIDHVNNATYPNGTRVGRTVARALACGDLMPDDVARVLDAAHTRRQQLLGRRAIESVAPPPAYEQSEQPRQLEEWTPSAVAQELLDQEAPFPDWQARALPNGDRSD